MQISQMQLVVAIHKALAKQDVATLNVRQLNTVIKAADMIVDEIARETVRSTKGMGLEAWLRCDDVGLSSEYMARRLTGYGVARYSHPYDADDFGRCLRMLDAVPELKGRVGEMADASDIWCRLVSVWNEAAEKYTSGDTAGCDRMVREAVADLVQA